MCTDVWLGMINILIIVHHTVGHLNVTLSDIVVVKYPVQYNLIIGIRRSVPTVALISKSQGQCCGHLGTLAATDHLVAPRLARVHRAYLLHVLALLRRGLAR